MAGTVFFSVSMSLDGFIAPGSLGDLMGEQWMELQSTVGVTKDTQFTKWSAQLASDLQQETLQTVVNETLTENGGQGGTLTELLTSGESYINADVANFYGVPAPSGSQPFLSATITPAGTPPETPHR